ncbi:MAG: MscS family rane protein [Candidatus Woesearchaeota archaeon]|nr:MscS family rane protein [Candidatus Woesearchaeota archaeon]
MNNITNSTTFNFLAKSSFQNISLNAFFAIILFVVLVTIAFFLNKILKKILLDYAKKTKSKFDDVFVEKFQSKIFYLFIFITFRILSVHFNLLPDLFVRLIDSLILIISLVIVARIVSIFIDLWAHSIAKKVAGGNHKINYVSQSFAPILQKINTVIFFTIILTSLLYLWGVNVTPILGGLGIAGLAISLAAKDLLSNVIGGISLAADMSFKVGDRVTLPEHNISGVVYDIGLRTTRIKTWDNQIIMVPNGLLANSIILNDNQPNLSARVVVPFSVEYGSDPDKVKKVVLSAVKKIPNVLDDPEPSVVFVSMGDFSLNFEAKYWVHDVSMKYDAKLEGVQRIYEALNKAGIGIPFPTHTVYLNDTKKSSSKTSKSKKTKKTKK